MNQNNSPSPNYDFQNVLFVSDLPKETTEEDLNILFKNYHVMQIKVNSSKSSTYAYVYFDNPDYANRARKDLNGEILIPKYGENKTGRPVRICKYEMKSTMLENINDPSKSLLVKNLDNNITAKDFYKMFNKLGEVKSSKLEVDENGVSKNYGYVLFTEASCAESAIQKLNGKEINGKILEVVYLVPSKSKDSSRNNIYVKNFPRDFTDEDLSQLFVKYGDISSVIVCRDDKGMSKGFGFVCFSSPLNAVQAIKYLKEKNITFPGLPPLYVNLAMKKEERSHYHHKDNSKGVEENAKFIATFINDADINSPEDFDNELRLFIKVILLQEYFPKKIEINFGMKTAIISLNSCKDLEEFYKKYAEYMLYNYPKFMIQPYIEQVQMPNLMNFNPNVLQSMPDAIRPMPGVCVLPPGLVPQSHHNGNQFNPNMFINQFSNLSLNPPLSVPVPIPVHQIHHQHIIYVDPNKPNVNVNVPKKNFNMHMNVPMNMNMNYSQGSNDNSRPVIKNSYLNQGQGKGYNHYHGQRQAYNNHQNQGQAYNNHQNQGQAYNNHQSQSQGLSQGYNPSNNNHTNNKPNQRNYVSEGFYNHNQEQELTNILGNNKPKQPENDDPAELEEYAAEIYDVVENRYPGDAGKITGMIVDFGLEEMKTLIKQKDKLEQVVDEAYELLHKA